MEVQQDPNKGKATASLVCGILGLVFTIFSYTLWLGIAAIILSIVGLILGISARKSMPASTTGMATAGLVLDHRAGDFVGRRTLLRHLRQCGRLRACGVWPFGAASFVKLARQGVNNRTVVYTLFY